MKRIIIAGTDEAGRGPLAGPVVAAAVILNTEERRMLFELGLRDSKKISEKKRNEIFKLMCDIGVIWGAHVVSHRIIDDTNILAASLFAMKSAIHKLSLKPDLVLVDGSVRIPVLSIPQKTIIKGDDKVLAISAASVIAKVLRDKIMTAYDRLYPEYNFAKHKGYPTVLHKKLLAEFGPSPVHRLSFRGVLRDE